MQNPEYAANYHGARRSYGIGVWVVMLPLFILVIGFAMGYFSFDDDTDQDKVVFMSEPRVLDEQEIEGLETPGSLVINTDARPDEFEAIQPKN